MATGEDPRRTGPSAGDGRNISADLGSLLGEGAEQESPTERAGTEGAARSVVWAGPPPVPNNESPAYYDRPVLKEPVWIWAVPVYFFCGGAAGAAAVLGEAARVLGTDEMRRLSSRCRWVSAAGTTAGAVLLIYDLGRPGRFFNMLRVFRPTSAMSVGSWTLAASGALSAAAAGLTPRPGRARTNLHRQRRAAGDLAALGSAVFGLPLASYTAVLLSDTAVPLWQQVQKPLPALFVSSAVASSAALLKLGGPDQASAAAVVRRFGVVGASAEILSALAVEKAAEQVERVGRPLHEGLPGRLWRMSKGLSAASLGLALFERGSRPRQVASALTGAAAGLTLRFAVFYAGKESARDPRAAFEQQRAGARMQPEKPAR